jgi:hypothetical protein
LKRLQAVTFKSYVTDELGTAAEADIGTSGATVPLLNAANTWSAAQVYSGTVTFSNTATAQTAAAGTNNTNVATTAFVQQERIANPPQNYLTGLTLSAAGSTATYGIAPGQATDSANDATMALASAYTKTTSAWAVGSGTGSLDTGTIANSTWYHVWLIRRSDTGVVDVLASTSATAPTLPTSYDQKRRIGAMKTDGSAQWVKFLQVGDDFTWDAPVHDASGTSIVNTALTVTLSTPLGVKVDAKITAAVDSNYSGTVGYLFVSPLDVTSAAAAKGNAQLAWLEGGGVGAAAITVRTNTSSQIRAIVDNSNTTNFLNIYTQGWIDSRGRNG